MDISGDGSITLDRRAFKALASETRVEILKKLDGTQKTVSDLARDLDMNKATMFQHLEQLVDVGLVKKDSEEDRATTVKEAPNVAPVQGPPKKWVYYRLSWKGKNVLHPERVKIALALSIAVVSCLLVLVVYAMLQGAAPGLPSEKDTRPPMVVSWDVQPVQTDSVELNVLIHVEDNRTGKVSGLDENATVLRWGVASDTSLAVPDVLPWSELHNYGQLGLIGSTIRAIDWSLFAGRYLVIEVELKDRAGNSASYRFSERVAPASGPDLKVAAGGLTFDRVGAYNYQFRLSVMVTNSGTANATNVTVSVFARDPDVGRTGKASANAEAVATGQAAFIGAGGSETVNLTIDSRHLASRTIYLMVDPADTVPETNEGDNVVAGVIPAAIPVGPPKAAGAQAPGMELAAAALALGAAAVLAGRRRLGDGR
jgi:DNA-binding transcriptional ArsR family regulator